jgi:hypothetical protein
MKLIVYLFDERYCEPCPYSVGICGCSKYKNEDGYNTNCGCTEDGRPLRLIKCRTEND